MDPLQELGPNQWGNSSKLPFMTSSTALYMTNVQLKVCPVRQIRSTPTSLLDCHLWAVLVPTEVTVYA